MNRKVKNLILIIITLIITGCHTTKDKIEPLGPLDDNYGKNWANDEGATTLGRKRGTGTNTRVIARWTLNKNTCYL